MKTYEAMRLTAVALGAAEKLADLPAVELPPVLQDATLLRGLDMARRALGEIHSVLAEAARREAEGRSAAEAKAWMKGAA